MQGLFYITKNSMKKKKGDFIVLFALISLGAMLLYTSISVFLGMGMVQDLAYEKAHTADFLYMTNGGGEKLSEILSSREEVAEYEESPAMYLQSVKYKKRGETEEKEFAFVLGKLEEERKIGILPEPGRSIKKMSIYLPYYMKAAEGYGLGDSCFITIGEREYSFEVAGFAEDPLFATPSNISCYSTYISEECFEELIRENETAKAAECIQYKVRLKPGEDSFEFDKNISAALNREMPELSEYLGLGVNFSTMKQGASIMSNISMGIILVFSVILIVVVLLIIRFSIHNFMEMNRKNIGILMAAGYTSKQLNFTAVMEMGFLAFFGSLFGIALGVLGSGVIGNFQGIMIGLSWNQTFHLPGAVCTAMAVMFIVALVSYLSGRTYRKISVLYALRGGIDTHNFKKNYFSLEKTRLPLNLAISWKNIFAEKKKNLSVFCIVALLAFSCCIGFSLYENFGTDNEMLLQMIGIDVGNICLSGENIEEVGREMETWEEVEDVLYCSTMSVSLESGSQKTESTCDVSRNPELMRNEMIVEGRRPKYENEVVLSTGIADILQVEAGDSVYLTGQGERKSYVVCGIDQKITNMGLRVTLSEIGAKNLNGDSTVLFLYVYVREGVDVEKVMDKTAEKFPGIEIQDSSVQIKSVTNGIALAMKAICIIFGLITVFVVVIVEILLVKTKVVKERKHFGLNKAVGFTTVQLIRQVMVMNLPVIFTGGAVGAGLSIFFMEPLVVICLSFCKIKVCPLKIHLLGPVASVFGILFMAAFAAFLASVKIRKIEPVSMLGEE
ncbi:ABC transporter permease [Lachnospiraceae bacterium 38-14]